MYFTNITMEEKRTFEFQRKLIDEASKAEVIAATCLQYIQKEHYA